MSFYADFMAENAEPGILIDTFKASFEKARGGFFDNDVHLQDPNRASGNKQHLQNNYPVRSSDDPSRRADQGNHFAFFLVVGAGLQGLPAAEATFAIAARSYGLEVLTGTARNLGDYSLRGCWAMSWLPVESMRANLAPKFATNCAQSKLALAERNVHPVWLDLVMSQGLSKDCRQQQLSTNASKTSNSNFLGVTCRRQCFGSGW